MRIIDQIHERSAFTPTEREIATFLEENSKEAVNLSLDELSEKIFVSKSTVIRFCKKLGFKGHKELCVELAKELSMKKDIHPKYYKAKVICTSCGAEFETGSTLKEIKVDTWLT